MSPYGTKVAEAFSAKSLEVMYESALFDYIVNRDYEGEINAIGSKVNILSVGEVDEKDYTGADLTVDDLTESNAVLEITVKKSFYFKKDTLDEFLSFVKNPEDRVINQIIGKRRSNIDKFIFGLYGDVASGNRVGTDYVTGTVVITATSGAVAGTGTTFTSAMVGKGFKAVGHSKWYRVKTYTSATAIVIENDSDDEVSAYDGGALSGVAYVIEAATVFTLDAATVLAKIGQIKLKLDQAQVPAEGRWLVLPSEVVDLLMRGTGISLSVPAFYEALTQKGMITQLLGFNVFMSNNLTGNNTDGYHILAGTSDWVTFAEKQLWAQTEEDIKGNFGAAYKDLFVYGAKVADRRRKFAAELFAKV